MYRDESPVLSWAVGVIRFRDPRLFDARGSDAIRRFLGRVFRLDEVRWVEIDRASATASIGYAPEALAVDEALARLSGAIGRESGRDEVLPDVPSWLALVDEIRFKVFRHERLLTTWEVAHAIPGRVRLRQEKLRGNPALARRVERELATVHGVIDAAARPITAGLLVRFDPASTNLRHLLLILEGLLHAPGTSSAEPGHAHAHPPVSFALANASVGLAALGELAVPALLPASALLLLASNLRTFREAGRAVRRRQLGLSILTTFIVAATLATGQFLVAAVMSWSIKFWHRRYRARVHEARNRLLSELIQHRRFAWACVGDTLVEVAVETLRAGDTIAVGEDELVAADGTVTSGEAMVDERPVRGGQGLSRKGPGDPIFAGSWVVGGEIRVVVSGQGPNTRAATVGRALVAASATTPARFAVTSHGETFAQQAVGPTLAFAGLGLLVGDATTAAAILRPDYATGPGMGLALHLLQDLTHAAQAGLLIRDASAIRKFAEVDTIIFEDHPDLRRTGLEVVQVEGRGGAHEDDLVRYAATAYQDLADDRSRALLAECEARHVVPFVLDRPPRYLGPGIDIFLDQESGPIHVRELPGAPETLLVSAAERTIGTMTFARSARPEAARVFERLREGGTVAVGLVSDRPEAEVGALASALGADFYQASLSAIHRTQSLRSDRARGLKVAYIGDCRNQPEVARAAYLAISRSDVLDLERDPAPILLLGPDLGAIAGLRALARSHVSRAQTIVGSILIPNLFCIAGAFLLGFTTLSAVVLTNLGTLTIDVMAPRSPSRRRAKRPLKVLNVE